MKGYDKCLACGEDTSNKKYCNDNCRKKYDYHNKLIVDPSIHLDVELNNILTQLKIDIISYCDNEEILTNIYFTMKAYFNDVVIKDIMESTLTQSQHRELILNLILRDLNKKQ